MEITTIHDDESSTGSITSITSRFTELEPDNLPSLKSYLAQEQQQTQQQLLAISNVFQIDQLMNL